VGAEADPRYVNAWRKAGPAEFNALKWSALAVVPCGLLLFIVPGWGVIWGVATVAQIGLYVQKRRAFPCPRCGEHFGDAGEFPLFRRPSACQHCGLPYGSPRDPDANAGE